MARNIAVGIDVGTYQVKVLVAESLPEREKEFPKIIGTGVSESRGLRHGYIVNVAEATESIKNAVTQAEKNSGIKIKRVFMAIGGIGLEAAIGNGSVLVSRGDSEVTDLDVEKVIEAARAALPKPTTLNRRVIHTVPLSFKVDGQDVLGNRPTGLKGMRLEARVFFVTALERQMEDLVEALENAGLEVEDAMASPLSASLVSLSKTQKMAGCVLANIGAETVSIVVFENGLPVSLEVFPLGSRDITNDIALGLRVSLEEAERLKLGAITSASIPKKKFEEILNARLSDIFDLIEAHLKKIGRNGLLPAGIIITGGGSALSLVEERAKTSLKLPSKISLVSVPHPVRNQVKDASWTVSYGLSVWAFSGDDSMVGTEKPIGSILKNLGKAVLKNLRPFLP